MAVRLEEVAFGDARFIALGELGGYNAYEALGRMAHLWRYCTQRSTYIAPESIIRACLGPCGVEALLDADLAERTEQGVRVRGTVGRVEWLEEARSGSKVGGEARAATASRGPDGRMLPRQNGDSIQRNPADSPPGGQLDQPVQVQPPASSSPLVITPALVTTLKTTTTSSAGGVPALPESLTVGDLVAVVQTWEGWDRFIGLKPKWQKLALELSPFSRSDVLTAKAEAERAGGQPVIGLLLRILERYRNEPEAERVKRRESTRNEAQRPKSTYKPISDDEREPRSAESMAVVSDVLSKLRAGGP